MYHSILFGDKNTWDDWHLVPSSRPLFNPPSVKTKYVDIPGYNGSLDLTESLTKYPVFNNREGSFEFYVMNGYWEWYEAYSTIMNYLHGKEMRAYLEDDPSFFYIGRFAVNSWKSDKDYSKIVIDYSVKPFKYYKDTTGEPYIWDTFNFETDMALDALFGNIPVTKSVKEIVISSEYFGTAPTIPTLIASVPMTMRFVNEYLGIDKTFDLTTGINKNHETVLYGQEVKLYFNIPESSEYESGTITIDFRLGGL